MELSEIISSGAVALIAVVGFFLKKVLNNVDEIEKDMQVFKVEMATIKNQVVENSKHIQRNEDTMFKKFTSIHTREEKQREINEKIHITLAQINGKLDILIKKKSDDE